MAEIHPSALVGKEAELGDDVEIGPRCTLKGAVKLGDGVRLIGDVYLQGPITIGAGTVIYPFACLGFPPQDIKIKLGDPTPGIVIGKNCTIREHVTVHAATHAEIPTTIGDRVFMMVNSHAGHDSRIGSDVVLVNNVSLAGHTVVGDRAILSGNCAVHQFVKIGRLAFIGGLVALTCDVPPFSLCAFKNEMTSINVVGMRRAGFSNKDITTTRRAFREAFRHTLPKTEIIEILERIGADCEPVAEIAAFVRAATRPICHSATSRQHAPPVASVDA